MAGILIGVKSAYACRRLFEPARAPNRLPRAGNDERLGSREAGSRCSPPMGQPGFADSDAPTKEDQQ
jgi:hypothetical protein